MLPLPNNLVSSFLQKLGRQDDEAFNRNVEWVVEDTLETLAEHYVEELVDLAEGGTEDDEDSPWWEWILQDVLKAGLEHFVIERLVHFRQPKTSE